MVGLQHRELGGVRRIDALIAEDAPHLEDAIRAADHRPLQVQFERDSETHVDVERIEVRAERAGGCAAVQELEDRGLDLHVALPVEGFAHCSGDGGAIADHFASFLADDQVDIATTNPRLLGQVLVQHGKRTESLGGHLPLRRHDGQLAPLGLDDASGDEDVIAQIDVGLPSNKRLVANLGEGQHHLQTLAVALGREAVLQRRECKLAGVADEHDAAPDGHDVLGLFTGLEVWPAFAHLPESVGALEIRRVRLHALLKQASSLLLADRGLFRIGGDRVVSHARNPIWLLPERHEAKAGHDEPDGDREIPVAETHHEADVLPGQAPDDHPEDAEQAEGHEHPRDPITATPSEPRGLLLLFTLLDVGLVLLLLHSALADSGFGHGCPP